MRINICNIDLCSDGNNNHHRLPIYFSPGPKKECDLLLLLLLDRFKLLFALASFIPLEATSRFMESILWCVIRASARVRTFFGCTGGPVYNLPFT
mmetsp:Transcript_120/g.344  ORF Transcript_120/g.344 Transcript_120/m.344 type:complete len:95 (+) Transcript_120:102-386(+)